MSPAPLGGVATAQYATQELCGKARLETAPEPSQVSGKFRPAHPRSFPRGIRLLLCRLARSSVLWRAHLAKKAPPGKGGARKGHEASGSDQAWQSLENLLPWGGVKKHVTQLQSEMQPER